MVGLTLLAAGLAGCGAVSVVDPTRGEAFQEFDFEDVEVGSAPGGWSIKSSNLAEDGGPASDLDVTVHTATIDDTVAHSGKRSLRISAPTEASSPLVGFVSYCATPSGGKRLLELRLAVRAETDLFNVSLNRSLANTAVIVSRGDWAEHRLLFISPDDGEVCLRLVIHAAGAAWVDDITLAAADFDLASDGNQLSFQNEDMEEQAEDGAPAHWSAAPAPPGQTVELTTTELGDGSHALRLHGTATTSYARPAASQCIAPGGAAAVHLRGFLRPEPPEGGEGDTRMYLAAITLQGSRIPSSVIERLTVLRRSEAEPELRRLFEEMATGTAAAVINTSHLSVAEGDWTEVEMVAVVPPGAEEICVSVHPPAGGAVLVDKLDIRALEL